jgi:hypothetical protein
MSEQGVGSRVTVIQGCARESKCDGVVERRSRAGGACFIYPAKTRPQHGSTTPLLPVEGSRTREASVGEERGKYLEGNEDSKRARGHEGWSFGQELFRGEDLGKA